MFRGSLHTFLIWSFSLHGGGFPSPVVPQEGCDLAFVEIDAEMVYSRTRTSRKLHHQVLDLNASLQAQWIGLKEHLTCMEKQNKKMPLYHIMAESRN